MFQFGGFDISDSVVLNAWLGLAGDGSVVVCMFDSSYQVWTEKFTIVGGVSYLRYHRVQSLLLGVMSSKSALNLMSKILRMK